VFSTHHKFVYSPLAGPRLLAEKYNFQNIPISFGGIYLDKIMADGNKSSKDSKG
jgi:hypothetical protein